MPLNILHTEGLQMTSDYGIPPPMSTAILASSMTISAVQGLRFTYFERSLSYEARETFLSALVSEGRAEWIDKGRRKCLILWLRIQDWADSILRFVRDNGLEDSVMTIEEIRTGIESRGTDLHGMDRAVLTRALRLLEQKGKAAIFKGTSADDEGVKFSA
ncbi:hypothetical protein GIB67_042602 [Kingdonia uniflora]|uniref:ESCRT-II complex subunit VPS25 n=1 Tax=Kingdonia uniflora TaxID=39325 RepID=A0A7J7M1A5_9MAGN|nr:hypothetical protein GIB67_042602 [Kingdonia uniflora]